MRNLISSSLVLCLSLLLAPVSTGADHGGVLPEIDAILTTPLEQVQAGTGTNAVEAAAPSAGAAMVSGNTGGLVDDESARRDPASLYSETRVRVTARRHTVLSTQATGRIERLSVRDGDRFQAGQVLLAMDPTLEQIAVDRARALVRRQNLLLAMNKELVELESRGAIELNLAATDVEQAEAELRMAEARLERTRIVAPFSGRVGDVFVREMQYVPEGQPALEILDDNDLQLEFIVSSMWLGWFRPGYAFTVVIDETGSRHDAVLTRIGGKVDPLSRSIKVYADFSTPSADLMEGMSGEAVITPPGQSGQ